MRVEPVRLVELIYDRKRLEFPSASEGSWVGTRIPYSTATRHLTRSLLRREI